MAQFLESLAPNSFHPLIFALLFLGASFLMVWRLEALSDNGIEGTVLGTVVMPYCSGLGNLIFAFIMGRTGGPGGEVMTNCLVNNVTNLTLLLGLPALIWGLNIIPPKQSGDKKKKKKDKKGEQQVHRLNRLSLLLTMMAVLFFTGAVWALSRDGNLDFGDGLVLVGLFLFWQCFQIFDVLKNNVRQNRSFGWLILVDFSLLLLSAYGIYVSIDWLVVWISKNQSGFLSVKHLGWLSGWLMVLPNAILAIYYGWKGRADVTYSSQVGDGHICIPLCLGLFTLFKPMPIPPGFQTGVVLILAATAIHFASVVVLGRLPRWLGALLIGAYAVFVFKGFF